MTENINGAGDQTAGLLEIPMMALRGITVFPNMNIHFDVGREMSIRALDAAMTSGKPIFLVAQKDLGEEKPGLDGLYQKMVSF